MNQQFRVTLYTLQQLSNLETIQVLWRLLENPLITPKRYDAVERAKIPFSHDAVESALKLYQNEGFLFIRGEKDGFLGVFAKQPRGLSTWDIWLDLKALQGEKAKLWLDWIFRLCSNLPVLYGCGFSLAEYNAKHAYVRELPGGRSVSGTIGVSIAEFYQYLPGLYWLTIFGAELVQAFSKSTIIALPNVEVFSLDSQQIAMCLNQAVLTDNMEQRLQTESQLADILGAQFFFDRQRTNLKFEPIPQLAEVLKDFS
jgi:hypothetical protein